MPAYIYRKGYAFNQMNFAGLLVGGMRLVYLLVFASGAFPVSTRSLSLLFISHDLRTPIQGLTLLLADQGRSGEDLSYLAQNLPMVKDELKTTNELLDNLLKWSQLQMTEGILFLEDNIEGATS